MISQYIVFNQASFSLEYLIFQVIISLRKWSDSFHILIFLRQVLQSSFSLEQAFSLVSATECQLLLEKSEIMRKVKISAIPKYLAQCSLNFLEIWSLFWIFFPAVFYKQIYLEKEGWINSGGGILFSSTMGVTEVENIFKTSQLQQ